MTTIAVYRGADSFQETALSEMAMWVGDDTTEDGVITLHPTQDGTVESQARFGIIFGALAMSDDGDGAATAIPISCAVKSVSADKKTVEVAVVRGVVLALLGATLQFVPDGTRVTVMLLGTEP